MKKPDFLKKNQTLAQEKLLPMRKNEYQLFYEFAPVGYFDLDKLGRIIKLNLRGAQLLGCPRTHLYAKQFLQFVHENAKMYFSAHIRQACIRKIKQSCILELVKEDGSSFYSQLEMVEVTDPTYNRTWIHLSIIDINEYQLATQALKESEEKFRSLVENTKEWIWAIDTKGRFLYNNPAVTPILGYSPRELLNCSRFKFIHRDDRARMAKIFPLLVKEKKGWNDLSLRWQRKDESYCHLESNADPYFNHKGELIGFRGADRDITTRKQIEAQKQQRQSILNKISKNNSLGEFISTLVHQLSQPLTGVNNYITGCIYQLDAKTFQKKTSILKKALQQASEQTEHVGRIIHSIKDLVQHGKLHFEKVEINKVICESIELIKQEFPYTPVKITFRPENRKIFLIADKIQLEQVMLNLLRNGIEAMTQAATLDPELQVKSKHYDMRRVYLSVSDNGPGFGKGKNLSNIFDAFFSTKPNNMGMGLAICRTIIEAHQGRLTTSRNTHKGMSFQFILPVSQENDQET